MTNVPKKPGVAEATGAFVKGCLGLVFALAALAVVVVIMVALVSGGGTTAKTKTTSGSSVPQSKQEALSYIKDDGPEARHVQAIIRDAKAMLAAGAMIAGSFEGSAPEALNELAQFAQEAHDRLDESRNTFTVRDEGEVGQGELEVSKGANELKNAMGALVAYTGTPNPATLAHFHIQYQSAISEWNEGVRAIWQLAGARHAPTV